MPKDSSRLGVICWHRHSPRYSILGSHRFVCHSVPWLEGGSGELQVCQPDLGVREGHGADHPAAHTGQPGDQHGYTKDTSCLTKLDLLLNSDLLKWMRQRLWMCLPGFNKAFDTFDTISHSIVRENLASEDSNGCTVISRL